MARMSKHAALANLKAQGFLPGTVLGVGAQTGTSPLYEVFPDAHHILFEPVAEREPHLRALCSGLKSAEYHMAAVTERTGQITLTVSPDRNSSGVVPASANDGADYRSIPAIALNDICSRQPYPGPFLVKIDVDGCEIDVLKGGSSLIGRDNVFVVEATIGHDDARFPKVLDFFRPYDFILHDIVDPMFRPADGALWQVDIVMVHSSSPYRKLKMFQ